MMRIIGSILIILSILPIAYLLTQNEPIFIIKAKSETKNVIFNNYVSINSLTLERNYEFSQDIVIKKEYKVITKVKVLIFHFENISLLMKVLFLIVRVMIIFSILSLAIAAFLPVKEWRINLVFFSIKRLIIALLILIGTLLIISAIISITSRLAIKYEFCPKFFILVLISSILMLLGALFSRNKTSNSL